jgi:hypothetical protein
LRTKAIGGQRWAIRSAGLALVLVLLLADRRSLIAQSRLGAARRGYFAD